MSDRERRIAVTGIGMVTALGRGSKICFDRLVRGHRAISEMRALAAHHPQPFLGAEIPPECTTDVSVEATFHNWSRAETLAIVAAREAIEQSGLQNERISLVLGSTAGGIRDAEGAVEEVGIDQSEQHDAGQQLILRSLGSTAVRVAAGLQLSRQTIALCSACSSGSAAIVQAAQWLTSGQQSAVLAGGVDALSHLTTIGFSAIGAMANQACRPFDIERSGLNLGEGAGFLVLETEAAARARGRSVLAVLSGWSLGSEAYHLTHPEPSASTATWLLREALKRAGLDPKQIDYVNAHGTGTLQNDAMEARALGEVFGDGAGQILVSSCKGQIGHTLGASGAIEAAVTVMAIERGIAPPTAGLVHPLQVAGLEYVTGEGKACDIHAAISTSFGFGGAGAVLVFESSRTAQVVPKAHPLCSTPNRAASGGIVVTGLAALGSFGLLKGPAGADLVSDRMHSPAMRESIEEAVGRLDQTKMRRFDRLAEFVTLGVVEALGDAELAIPRIGLVVANRYGNVTRTIAFLARLYRGGPRSVSPAEFPHLLASAASSNASIYAKLTGPILTVSAGHSGADQAFRIGLDLLGDQMAEAVVVGVAEPLDSNIEDAVLTRPGQGPRSAAGEGAAWLVLEEFEHARARGATRAVRVGAITSRVSGSAPWFEAIPSPRKRHEVVVHDGTDQTTQRLLADSPWSKVPRLEIPPLLGCQPAGSGFALVCAAARVLSTKSDVILAVTSSDAGSHAVLFETGWAR